MITILFYLYLYMLYWYCIVQLLFPGMISFDRFTILAAVAVVIAAIRELKKRNWVIDSKVWYVILLLVLICVFYLITGFRYGIDYWKKYLWNGYLGFESYVTYLKVLLSQVCPGAIVAILAAVDTEIQRKIKALAPYTAMILSVAAAYTPVYMLVTTGSIGVYVTDYGMNYNSNSYMAAFAASLLLYSFFSGGTNQKLTRESGYRGLLYILFFLLDTVVVFTAGGRGGPVAYLIIHFFLILKLYQRKRISTRFILWILMIAAALAVLIVIAGKSSWGQAFVSRNLRIFKNGVKEEARYDLYVRALRGFLSAPASGHGIGSVFHETGFYSHNIFLDLMVEGGIPLLTLAVGFMAYIFRKGRILERIDEGNRLWVLLFLQGLTQSLFGGYYLGDYLIWASGITLLLMSNVSIHEGSQERHTIVVRV